MTKAMESPVIEWPDGARCAVSLGWHCDGETYMHIDHRASVSRYLSPMSYFQYDEVAVPRIARTFAELGVRQTFCVPAWCLERYPDAFSAVLEHGHELALHGYLHERPSLQTPEAEQYWLGRAIEVQEKFAGERPVGYTAPWADLSERTFSFLIEAGLLYDASLLNDDVPYVLRTGNGSILELPTDYQTNDDWSQFAQIPTMDFLMQPQTPERAVQVWMAEFEAAYAAGGVFITGFHPFLSGRRARLAAIRNMTADLLARGDVWVTTLRAIAEHVQRMIASGSYAPRTMDWPFLPPDGIPELADGFPDEVRAIR